MDKGKRVKYIYYYENYLFSFLDSFPMTTFFPVGKAFETAGVAPAAPSANSIRDKIKYPFSQDQAETLAKGLADILAAMGLPIPVSGALVTGAAGVLLALDDYGLIMRLEQPDSPQGRPSRVDNHPLVLQTLKSHDMAGQAILEICPGIHILEGEGMTDEAYRRLLRKAGVDFWDGQRANVGILPLAGTKVVLDRLAVARLAQTPEEIRKAWRRAGPNTQRALYKDLRAAMRKAWPDGQALPDTVKFQQFLQLCRQKKAEGVLVSGWQRDPNARLRGRMHEQYKRGVMADAGVSYALQMR